MKLYLKDDNSDPYVIIQDDATAAPAGYTLTNTVTAWNDYGLQQMQTGVIPLLKDYKAVRNEIKKIVTATGYTNLELTEKEIASKWVVVVKSDRDTVFSEAQQIANGVIFHENSIQARTARNNNAIAKIENHLSDVDADEVIDDSELLVDKYINYGREGTIENDPEGLFDYFEARTGTSYDTTGLKSKSFTVIGIEDLDTLVTEVMDILKNGNY